MVFLLIAILLYLCGSIPFGLLFGALFKTGDIRKIGSGNIGATNMLRTGNKGAALLTLLCDFLKGLLPILFVQTYFGFPDSSMNVLYVLPVLGHIFPVWLKFKGGKGVATGVGVLFAASWELGLTFIGIWLIVAYLSRISSLAGLVAFTLVSCLNVYLVTFNFSIWLMIITLLIFYTHRDNIRKIVKGQETKIGERTAKNKRQNM